MQKGKAAKATTTCCLMNQSMQEEYTRCLKLECAPQPWAILSICDAQAPCCIKMCADVHERSRLPIAEINVDNVCLQLPRVPWLCLGSLCAISSHCAGNPPNCSDACFLAAANHCGSGVSHPPTFLPPDHLLKNAPKMTFAGLISSMTTIGWVFI